MIAAERARRNACLGGVNEAAEKFGPLKDLLRSILAAHVNREVRSFFSFQNSSINTLLGGCRLG